MSAALPGSHSRPSSSSPIRNRSSSPSASLHGTNAPPSHPASSSNPSSRNFLPSTSTPSQTSSTLILHPPHPLSDTSSPSITHIALRFPLLAVATNDSLIIFRATGNHTQTRLNNSCPLFTLLARWPCPPGHSITAMTLSPHADVIALAIYRPRNPAAILLIDPLTLTHLIRLALPTNFTYGSSRPPNHTPLTFISSANISPNANPPPLDFLPARLRQLVSANSTPVSRSPTDHTPDIEPWALTVSPSSAATTVILNTFLPGYRRIHRQSYIPLPDSLSNPALHPLPDYSNPESISLALVTSNAAYRFVKDAFVPIITSPDLPIEKLLGIIPSPPSSSQSSDPAILSLARRANNTLSCAIHHAPTVTLTATDLPHDELRAVELLFPSDAPPCISAVLPDGYPSVIASVHPRHPNSLPSVRLTKPQRTPEPTTETHNCPIAAPAALVCLGSTMITSYGIGPKIVVRHAASEP